MRKVSTYVLWVLVVVYAVVELVNPVFPLHIPIPLVVLIPVVFGLIHGAWRYKWSGILTFIVMCLVVSNILENTSILTGFPFGHYHYTDVLGPPRRSIIPGSGSKAVATSGCHSRTTWGGSSPCMCSSNCLPSPCVSAGLAAKSRRRLSPGRTTLRLSSCMP